MKYKILSSIVTGLVHLNLAKKIMVMEITISVLLLVAGIAVLVIIHMCIVGRAFRRGFASSDGVLQSGSVLTIKGRSGMNQQDLNTLPCFEYKEGSQIGTCPLDCAVCLDCFKVGDNFRILPNCQHWFHLHCIDVWLKKTPLCPLCRTAAKPLPTVHDSPSSAVGEQSNASIMVAADLL